MKIQINELLVRQYNNRPIYLPYVHIINHKPYKKHLSNHAKIYMSYVIIKVNELQVSWFG
ncbi:hypothetical protein Hanom_Chr08g00746491 [Helianthus anomalus]